MENLRFKRRFSYSLLNFLPSLYSYYLPISAALYKWKYNPDGYLTPIFLLLLLFFCPSYFFLFH